MNQLTILNRAGLRVLTTAQLAESYGAENDRVSKNFHENKERFTEGKHFFKLEGEQLREFKNDFRNSELVGKNASVLYLWTEKGAWMHAKSLNTDKAWEAYEMLVDDYYSIKLNTAALSPELQMFSQIFNSVARMEITNAEQSKRLEVVEKKIDTQNEILALNSINWREDATNLLNRAAQEMGGFEHIRFLRQESYDQLERRLGVSLSTRLTNKRRRMADEGVCKSKRDKQSKLDVIADDKKLIEGYVAIVKELALRHGGIHSVEPGACHES